MTLAVKGFSYQVFMASNGFPIFHAGKHDFQLKLTEKWSSSRSEALDTVAALKKHNAFLLIAVVSDQSGQRLDRRAIAHFI